MKKYIYIYAMSILFIMCKKSDYLSGIPDESIVIPKTLIDFQSILDNDRHMNGSFVYGLTPSLGQAASDDYFMIDSYLNGFSLMYRNLYTWQDDIYSSDEINDWSIAYQCVFYANEVLDGIKNLSVSANEKSSFNNIKGSALFYRAHIFYQLSQTFATSYDSLTAKEDYGVPLKLTSDINEKVTRSSVQQLYDQIISDLELASTLLPNKPLFKTRPSRPAVYGLLAKVYLSMRDYKRALLFSDSCITAYNTSLLDLNNLNTIDSYPFARFNNEVIFQSVMNFNTDGSSGGSFVDTALYNSFADQDLRKSAYFDLRTGYHYFKGSYDGTYNLFTGISNDEMFLIRSECNARIGNISSAMSDLNYLLNLRWSSGTFVTMNPTDSHQALDLILSERRKELVFRGTRWTDLRRLNKENYDISISRTLNGQTYELPANSLKYTFLVPPTVLDFNQGMPQNPR